MVLEQFSVTELAVLNAPLRRARKLTQGFKAPWDSSDLVIPHHAKRRLQR
jgi:hypothetical protein